MGVISKTAKLKISPRTFKYYRDLGYEFNHVGDEIEVSIEHLPVHSTVKILVECDFCKKTKMLVSCDRYNTTIEKTGSYACIDCALIKCKQTCQKIYGVENVAQLEEVKKKKIETSLERYDVKYHIQSELVQERTRRTMLERYGVKYPSQSTEIKNKIAQTAYKNNTIPTSKQQSYLFNLYKTVNDNSFLNYPISRYHADICLPEENLDIELDCGGHNYQVKIGKVTQEEFDRKEMIRNLIVKREGYKQMRIISITDKLPSDAILLQMLEETRKFFKENPERGWIEYNIDSSIVRNAEHKDGVFFNFGELRKIKDKDLEKFNNTTENGELKAS